MTPREIITQAIVKFDCALGPYYKHRHLLRDGEVTAEYRDAMRADLAEHILAALAAAGLVVIDPAKAETCITQLLEECALAIILNASDTFDYATADADRFVVDGNVVDGNLDKLIEVWERWGHDGVRALQAHIRNREPLEGLATPDYHLAREFLADWEYEDD